MDKSVLISIKPEHCLNICRELKTLEFRKNIPKIDFPFRCFIYCSKSGKTTLKATKEKHREYYLFKTTKKISAYQYPYTECEVLNGKVIGEFTCDYVLHNCQMQNADLAEQQGMVKRERIFEYANGEEVLGWHISNLIIYDKPIELKDLVKTEYPHACDIGDDVCECCPYTNYGENSAAYPLPNGLTSCEQVKCPEAYANYYSVHYSFSRPPQSWCYTAGTTKEIAAREV